MQYNDHTSWKTGVTRQYRARKQLCWKPCSLAPREGGYVRCRMARKIEVNGMVRTRSLAPHEG
ncbi:hypothetical protein HanIR_Chr03g0137541 [Helianthus annuus]|nr:hypothetical protein HanIR_Chr03g0137541 [Helianthus annuus]